MSRFDDDFPAETVKPLDPPDELAANPDFAAGERAAVVGEALGEDTATEAFTAGYRYAQALIAWNRSQQR